MRIGRAFYNDLSDCAWINSGFMETGGRADLPLSSLVMKIKVIPENTVGIPIIRPEKTADPPRCSAYALAEETIIKNENCVYN
jgi:hypothetical protein